MDRINVRRWLGASVGASFILLVLGSLAGRVFVPWLLGLERGHGAMKDLHGTIGGWTFVNHLVSLAAPFAAMALIMLVYALFLPRVSSALAAGTAACGIFLVVWVIVLASVTAVGLVTPQLGAASFLGILIVLPLSVWAGAAIYRGVPFEER